MSDKIEDSLGSTLAFPFRAENGSLKTVSGIEALEESIEHFVHLEKGGHVMHPNLGWNKDELIATGDSDKISQAIRQSIIDGEDRINHSDLVVKVEQPQNGKMRVFVTYSIKNDDNRRTMNTDVPIDY